MARSESAGLLAISLGLSRLATDDHDMLQRGFVVYDGLYAWLRDAREETHTWNPQRTAAPRSVGARSGAGRVRRPG